MTTISWNVNGFYTRLPEIQLLANKYKPDYLCLQETHLQPSDKTIMKDYNIYRQDRLRNNHGGVAILINKNNTAIEIPLTTNLEAVAVRVNYPEPCTICSIYIPPNRNITYLEMDQLIKSLPSPYIITGDFNAHNPIWKSTHKNQHGSVIEDILDTNILLNNGKPTHFCSQYGHLVESI